MWLAWRLGLPCQGRLSRLSLSERLAGTSAAVVDRSIDHQVKQAWVVSLPNVTLTDQDTSVVNGLGQTAVEDLGLQASLQEIFDLQAENVIELHLALVQDADANETSQQGVTLEQTLGITLVQGQELSGSLTDLGKSVTNSPYFVLVSQTVLTDQLQLLVKTLLLVWTTWSRVSLVVN